MKVRKQTPSGDMTFGSSALNFYIDQPEGVAQVVKTSLQLWLGEWSFDTSQGMPYLEGVLGKQSKATADITIQDYISGIEGVVDIVSYASVQNSEGRTFVSQLTIVTEFSETPIEVQLQTDF